MDDLAGQVQMLEQAKEGGCVGVEIGSSIGGARLDEPQFEPFWAGVARLGEQARCDPITVCHRL